VAAGEPQAMISHAAGERKSALRNIEPVHFLGVCLRSYAAAFRKIAGVGKIFCVSAEEIRVD
jgi:hypothetical protein